MKPKKEYITIQNNKEKIEKLLMELVLEPRLKALEWSKITKQTPNMKIGYPGQHLASLITGMEGSRTGARGDDLSDGTEVKSCSRVDQLDTCSNCKEKVLRIENKCPHCGSDKIKRMEDSKWLFSVKSDKEVKLLTKDIDRVFLTIADYPNFSDKDFNTIRFQAFELWNETERHKHFSTLMNNYYNKIFLEHIKKNPNKTPAPKNFWPYSYQFYLCNPVKVFSCNVEKANEEPKINIDFYVNPDQDRQELKSEPMPISLLSNDEVKLLSIIPKDIIEPQLIDIEYNKFINKLNEGIEKKFLTKHIPLINEETRSHFQLRDTDIISEAKTSYIRR
jgi:predicted RNA-binding Zn-ribbon protein involved in translation (DUF1610 family)